MLGCHLLSLCECVCMFCVLVIIVIVRIIDLSAFSCQIPLPSVFIWLVLMICVFGESILDGMVILGEGQKNEGLAWLINSIQIQKYLLFLFWAGSKCTCTLSITLIFHAVIVLWKCNITLCCAIEPLSRNQGIHLCMHVNEISMDLPCAITIHLLNWITTVKHAGYSLKVVAIC